ncbi:MAG: hypothetical protein M3Q64_01650 [bacterium]|nr:hypothetical protein [bacterium]
MSTNIFKKRVLAVAFCLVFFGIPSLAFGLEPLSPAVSKPLSTTPNLSEVVKNKKSENSVSSSDTTKEKAVISDQPTDQKSQITEGQAVENNPIASTTTPVPSTFSLDPKDFPKDYYNPSLYDNTVTETGLGEEANTVTEPQIKTEEAEIKTEEPVISTITKDTSTTYVQGNSNQESSRSKPSFNPSEAIISSIISEPITPRMTLESLFNLPSIITQATDGFLYAAEPLSKSTTLRLYVLAGVIALVGGFFMLKPNPFYLPIFRKVTVGAKLANNENY